MTTKPVAPDDAMTVVKCVTACRNCRGSDCCNSETQTTVVARNSDTSDVEVLDESASVLPDFLLDDYLYYCAEEIVMWTHICIMYIISVILSYYFLM